MDNWLEEPLEKLFASLKLENEWKKFTLRELVETNENEIQKLSLALRVKLTNVRAETVKQMFWRNSLENLQSIFSLDASRFVILPELVKEAKKNAALKRVLEKVSQAKPIDAVEEVLSFLAGKKINESCSSKFRLPNLLLEHRREVLLDFSELVSRIHTGQKRGNGNSGRILLGPKGTGKSTFLQSFAVATSLLYDSIIVIFVDYARVSSKDPVLPSQMLWYACKSYTAMDIQDSTDLSAVLGILRTNKLRTLIIADEFEKVFKWTEESLATKVVQQFQTLGGSTDGVATAVISGSSAALHDLCFPNNRRVVSKEEYPSFTGVSLNHGRYKVVYSRPLRGVENFRKVLVHIIESSSKSENFPFFEDKQVKTLEKILKNNEERLRQIYEMTGGKFRNIQKAIDDEKNFVETLVKEYNDAIKNPMFVDIVRRLSEKHSNATEQDVWLESNEIEHNHHNDIYLLGDQNCLFVEVTNSGPRVTYEYLLQKEFSRVDKYSITVHERTCLRYPFGTLGIDAEAIVLRSLEKNSQNIGLPKLEYKSRRLSLAKSKDQQKDHLKKDILVCGTTPQFKPKTRQTTKDLYCKLLQALPQNELLKEYPDKSGADATFFEQTETGHTAARMQIKLGVSTIGEEKAKTIVRKLKTGDEAFNQFSLHSLPN